MGGCSSRVVSQLATAKCCKKERERKKEKESEKEKITRQINMNGARSNGQKRGG